MSSFCQCDLPNIIIHCWSHKDHICCYYPRLYIKPNKVCLVRTINRVCERFGITQHTYSYIADDTEFKLIRGNPFVCFFLFYLTNGDYNVNTYMYKHHNASKHMPILLLKRSRVQVRKTMCMRDTCYT